MRLFYLFILTALALLGCTRPKTPQLTPWGTPVGGGEGQDSTAFDIGDIQSGGEMIMLTVSGPDTYYEYRGHKLGTQYLLCERFAQKLGVSLRVEVCKDTAEMVKRLNDGDADIIACQIKKSTRGVRFCGYAVDSLNTSWAVSAANEELADSVSRWFRPEMVAQIRRDERRLFSTQSIHRHTYAPMLNAAGGIISQYDPLFKRYAATAQCDWRLLAAQCYQESTFDPKAYSWAGACGLMQIMPATAAQVGLPHEQIFEPEPNISAAARYLRKLNGIFPEIRNRAERQKFVLGSYNGGHFHIRDAMALARKYGKNPYSWNDVAEFVLKLSQPQYYNDPVVKYGYMRGYETVGYVERILDRWAQYCGRARSGGPSAVESIGTDNAMPQKAHRRNRFRL